MRECQPLRRGRFRLRPRALTECRLVEADSRLGTDPVRQHSRACTA